MYSKISNLDKLFSKYKGKTVTVLKIAAREKAKLSSVSDDVDVEVAGC